MNFSLISPAFISSSVHSQLATTLTKIQTIKAGRVTKKVMLTSLFICSLFTLPVYALDDEGIEVSGQGSVIVVPDQFSLTLTITERGRVPSKLKAIVDKKSNAVISSAKSIGLKEGDITSARVNLRIIEEKPSIQVQGLEYKKVKQGSVYIDGQSFNQHTSQQNNQAVSNKSPLFELNRHITVNFNDIEQYDHFLGQVIKINVSRISSLSMGVEDREEYYQQALLIAINHATDKAKRMANKTGKKLGELKWLKEQSTNSYRPMHAEAMMSNSRVNTHSSLVGNQTINARVLVKFHLDD